MPPLRAKAQKPGRVVRLQERNPKRSENRSGEACDREGGRQVKRRPAEADLDPGEPRAAEGGPTFGSFIGSKSEWGQLRATCKLEK